MYCFSTRSLNLMYLLFITAIACRAVTSRNVTSVGSGYDLDCPIPADYISSQERFALESNAVYLVKAFDSLGICLGIKKNGHSKNEVNSAPIRFDKSQLWRVCAVHAPESAPDSILCRLQNVKSRKFLRLNKKEPVWRSVVLNDGNQSDPSTTIEISEHDQRDIFAFQFADDSNHNESDPMYLADSIWISPAPIWYHIVGDPTNIQRKRETH